MQLRNIVLPVSNKVKVFITLGNAFVCVFSWGLLVILSFLSEIVYSSHLYRDRGFALLNDFIDSRYVFLAFLITLFLANIYIGIKAKFFSILLYATIIQFWIYFVVLYTVVVLLLVLIITLHGA